MSGSREPLVPSEVRGRARVLSGLLASPGPTIMGVVNATPDSFSDGGLHLSCQAAVARAEQLVREGADLLDLGGESTRPGAPEVPAEVEAARVVPVVRALRERGCAVPVSVDTRKPAVARAALEAGADLVNDVSALADPELAEVVAAAGVPVVLMHMRGTPADMSVRAVYGDVVAEVERELAEALARAVRLGVREEVVVLDPGLGFAKRPEHSLAVMAGLGRLRAALGRPLLVGPSRKSFIGAVTGAPVGERLPGTLAAVSIAVLAGVEWVRAHDVGPARQAALVAAAIRDVASAGRGNAVAGLPPTLHQG